MKLFVVIDLNNPYQGHSLLRSVFIDMVAFYVRQIVNKSFQSLLIAPDDVVHFYTSKSKIQSDSFRHLKWHHDRYGWREAVIVHWSTFSWTEVGSTRSLTNTVNIGAQQYAPVTDTRYGGDFETQGGEDQKGDRW